ncbi:VTT domain-containing protein [Curtobacterium sp. A7_M15]|uniref:DedA family protein n=1 Tax=Curtobacterium sp. A7_M15 TaxID=3065241 RepID=UPI0027377D48|nr:VTT domain-containing protein [Curtobacterium sp. A7_M15]MDP4335313.1 VTT domain-containing protein [Curtobacterium sp. A7_M15]
MPSFLEGLPFRWLVLALFAVVFCRAQATYWLARLAVTGVARSRWGRWLDSAAVRRGSALLDRWGLPVVTISFLTVGLQTVVNAAAGVARVPWWRYTIAMVPGCVAWAVVYATVGLALFWAVLAAFAGSPWGAVVLVALAVGAAAVLWAVRRRRRVAADTSRP